MSSAAVDVQAECPQRVDELLRRAFELRNEDASAALALNEQAHEMALRIDYEHGVAYGLLRIALGRMAAAEDDDACLAQMQQATALMLGLGDARGEAEALNLQAGLYGRRNDHGRAIELYSRCIELRRRLGDREGEAGALNNLAVALRATHRDADALELLFTSLAVGEAIADDATCAYALCNIGDLLTDMGDPQSAIDHFERALALISRTRDRALESTVRLGLGRALAAIGREPLALAHLAQAVALARRTGNRSDLIDALAELGATRQQFGHLDDARQALDEALHALRPSPDRAAECRVLSALGRNHLLRGERDSALATLTQALGAAEAARSESGAAQAHQLLAAACEEAGDYAAALGHFRRFYEAEQRVGGREIRRRIRVVLTQAELGEARREADTQQRRAFALSHALDAERASAREKADLVAQLSQQAELLEKLAREDGLTSVANRRWLDLCLARECERARRFGHALSLAMISIDGFKSLNARHGLAAGDAVLRQVALLLRDSCRSLDLVGRYGGEAFLLMLTETPAEKAQVLCEKLRLKVAAFDWAAVHAGLDPVTISLGLAGTERPPKADELIAAAEHQLARARQLGMNRVCR